MEQVEIFCSGNNSILKERINAWLLEKKNKIEITHVLQSSDEKFLLTITIFYKDMI